MEKTDSIKQTWVANDQFDTQKCMPSEYQVIIN